MKRDLQQFIEAEQRLWEHIGATPTERSVMLSTGVRTRATRADHIDVVEATSDGSTERSAAGVDW